MAQRSDVRVENLRRANEQLASELRIERKPVSESCSAYVGEEDEEGAGRGDGVRLWWWWGW